MKRTAGPALLLIALVLLAFNLRTTVSSLPPLLSRIEGDLGLSGTGAGLLTALPVLCMAWFAPVAHRLAHRLGGHATALGAVALIGVGNAIRGAAPGDSSMIVGKTMLFGGTLMAGIGVAVCGVVLPGIVRAHFPRRTGAASGAYTVAMLVGASVSSALAVPLGRATGSWHASLAAWGLPAFLAVLAWLPLARGSGTTDTGPATAPGRLPWRSRVAWLLAGFFGLQASIAYAYITWLPAAYESRGWNAAAAGALLSLLHATQLPSALALPALSDRVGDRRPVLVTAAAASVLGALWLLLVPGFQPWMAATVLGFGLGGGFALALVLIVDYSGDSAGSNRLAALVFFLGYNVAAIVPALAGALRDLTGGFAAPWTLLTILAVAQLIVATRLKPGLR